MQATHEQLIAHALERIEVLEQQVLALQGQLARAVSLAEGGMPRPAKGPGRPRKTPQDPEVATFGDAARATDV
jgi:hypothetical protein